MSVEQAAAKVLREYLQAELDPQFGPVGSPERCVVSDRWPERESGLPTRAISIIPAGAREDLHVQEQDIRRENLDGEDGNLKLYTWRVAACRQPIQLDIWCRYSSHRDDLCARLEDSLRKGERYTLGLPNGNVIRDGVLLRMDPRDGFQGYADFTFEGPKKTDTVNGKLESESRATISGFIDVDLTVKAASPRMARVLLQIALDPTTDADAATSPDLIFTMNTETDEVVATGT
jgi:hypothetical protein